MKYQCNKCYSNVPCIIEFNIRMPYIPEHCPFTPIKDAKWKAVSESAKNTEQQDQADHSDNLS